MSSTQRPGQIMDQYLSENGFTEEDLAKAAGLDIEDIVDYLNGDGEFSLNLAIGMNELLGGEPPTEYWVDLHLQNKA